MHTVNEYQNLALRTVPEELQFWDLSYGSPQFDLARKNLLANAALGLCGEAREIEEDPSADEVGDGYWYVAVAAKTLGLSMMQLYDRIGYLIGDQPAVPDSDARAIERMYRSATAIAELAKKIRFHGKPVSYQLRWDDMDNLPEIVAMSDDDYDEFAEDGRMAKMIQDMNENQDGTEIAHEIRHNLALYVSAIEYLNQDMGMAGTMTGNIDKLRSRYPDGFFNR